jgi:hypothetical protein
VKFTAAVILMTLGTLPLVASLLEAGVQLGDAIRQVTVPLALAAGAGALIWSWAEPRVRRGR